MSPTWITEKEVEREMKNIGDHRRPICLDEKHEIF